MKRAVEWHPEVRDSQTFDLRQNDQKSYRATRLRWGLAGVRATDKHMGLALFQGYLWDQATRESLRHPLQLRLRLRLQLRLPLNKPGL